jgi:cyclase
MLRPRIIPCLLIQDGGLVKTVKFDKPKYVGDPLNAVKIFNEKEVDEIIVLDIDATVKNIPPNYDLIRKLAMECRMPLCYGGGVKSVEQISKIISLGVEKVAISSSAVESLDVISNAAKVVGSQSVVVVLDVKKSIFSSNYQVFTHNGNVNTKFNVLELAKKIEQAGAGEIVINSIERDGMMKGYDLDLMKQVRDVVSIPITALGGAGSLVDIGNLIESVGVVGAASGSLFVFKGIYRAVLINYPEYAEKEDVFRKCIHD